MQDLGFVWMLYFTNILYIHCDSKEYYYYCFFLTKSIIIIVMNIIFYLFLNVFMFSNGYIILVFHQYEVTSLENG